MDTTLDNLAENRLKAFTRLMSLASKLYHANPKNPPKPMNIADDDVLSLLTSLNRYKVQFLLVGAWLVLYMAMFEPLKTWICG